MSQVRGRQGSSARKRVPGLGWGIFIFVLLGFLAMPLLKDLTSAEATPSDASLANDATAIPTLTARATVTLQPTIAATATSGANAKMVPQWQLLLAAARTQIGGRYAKVGDTPETGFSCVGFVHWSFAQIGINVPESETGLANGYPHVSGAAPTGTALLPGDILIFHDTGLPGLSHAAIYAGNGKMVSADSEETGIREEPVNSPFWVAHWSLAVRVPGLTNSVPATGS